MSPPNSGSGPSPPGRTASQNQSSQKPGHHTESLQGESTPATQPTLDEALAERDRAAEAAELSLFTGWRVWAERELDRLIASGDIFSADDLRRVCGDPPDGEHVNGIGGLFLRRSKGGEIEFVGYKVSERPAARGRPVRCWRGTG